MNWFARAGILALGAWLTACAGGGTKPAADGGTVADGGSSRDGGGADGGTVADGGSTADGGTRVDATCAQPTAVTAGTPLQGTLVGRASGVRPAAASCEGLDPDSTYDGPSAVYSITVPAGKIMRASVHTDDDWDSAIAVVTPSACVTQPPSCLAAVDDYFGTTDVDETVTFSNVDGPQRDVRIVVLGLIDDPPPGGFTLTVSFSDPAAGDRCDAPIALTFTDGGVVHQGTLLNANDVLAPAASECPGLDEAVGGYIGPDVFYRVTVPGNTRMRATVTPRPATTEADFAIYAILPSQCGADAPVCLAAADAHADSTEPEELTYTNSTGSEESVILGVEGFFDHDDFTLVVHLAPAGG